MTENKKTTGKKTKKTGGVIIAVLLVWLISFLSNLSRDGDLRRLEFALRRFFLRSGLFELFHGSFTAALLTLVLVVALLIALIAFAASKKRKAEDQPVRRSAPAARGGSSAQHSHDRIQGYTAGSEDGYLHWKKQLDSFLAAGLIDRKEYNELLERRKDNFLG